VARLGVRVYRHFDKHRDAWKRDLGFNIVPTGCIGACDQPCAGMLQSLGKITYIIGHLQEERAAEQWLTCAALYREGRHGLSAYTMSPPALQARFVARIPPRARPGA